MLINVDIYKFTPFIRPFRPDRRGSRLFPLPSVSTIHKVLSLPWPPPPPRVAILFFLYIYFKELHDFSKCQRIGVSCSLCAMKRGPSSQSADAPIQGKPKKQATMAFFFPSPALKNVPFREISRRLSLDYSRLFRGSSEILCGFNGSSHTSEGGRLGTLQRHPSRGRRHQLRSPRPIRSAIGGFGSNRTCCSQSSSRRGGSR